MVRMLCSRSASLSSTTRGSLTIARKSLRTVSACCRAFCARAAASSRELHALQTSLGCLDLVELGHAIHDAAISGPNRSRYVFECEFGIFDGIVQQGRGDALGVHRQLGEDGRHCQWMLDEWLTRLPKNAGMRLRRDGVGALDEVEIILGHIVAANGEERGGRRQTRQIVSSRRTGWACLDFTSRKRESRDSEGGLARMSLLRRLLTVEAQLLDRAATLLGEATIAEGPDAAGTQKRAGVACCPRARCLR